MNGCATSLKFRTMPLLGMITIELIYQILLVKIKKKKKGLAVAYTLRILTLWWIDSNMWPSFLLLIWLSLWKNRFLNIKMRRIASVIDIRLSLFGMEWNASNWWAKSIDWSYSLELDIITISLIILFRLNPVAFH